MYIDNYTMSCVSLFVCRCVHRQDYIIPCVSLFVFLCVQRRLYNVICLFVCVSVYRYKYIMSCVSLFVFLCVQRQVYNSVCFFVRASVCQSKAGPQLDLCEALRGSVSMALTPILLCADEPHESSDCPFPPIKRLSSIFGTIQQPAPSSVAAQSMPQILSSRF